MNTLLIIRRLIPACVVAVCAAQEAAAIDTVWTYRSASGQIASSPAVGDINGDGADELVAADTVGNITAFSGSGQLLWRRHVPGPITIAPTLADVYPRETDGEISPLEVLVVNADGHVYCLDANSGQRVWVYALPHNVDWGRTSLCVSDLDHDGAVEIVAGDSSGFVACLSGEGDEIWHYAGTHGQTLCPASGDLDGDGVREIVVGGSNTALVCLTSEGKEVWRAGEGETGASPVLWDVDGDGRPEIVAGMGNRLALVNRDGTVRWTYAMQKEMDSAISVADADGDGALEIYAVDLSGHLACLAPDGSLRWSANVEQRARRSPSIADIDGDGVTEILVAGYSAAIHVFTPDGSLQERIPLPGPANATATIMKVGSGAADSWRIGVVCPSEDGTLQALRWPEAPEKSRILWPEYRLNSARTASVPIELGPPSVRIARFDLGTRARKDNVCRVQVTNPDKRLVTVTLAVQPDDGSGQIAVASTSDRVIEHSVPYRIEGKAGARLAFVCTVKEGEQVVAMQRRHAVVMPFIKDIADADERLATLAERLPQLADRSGAKDRLHLLKSSLATYRDRIESTGALSVREQGAIQEELDETLKAANTFSGVLEAALAAGSAVHGSLLLCAANPWASFGGLEEALEGRTPSPDLTVEAFGGEVESAALNIFNFGGHAKTFRIELDPLASGHASVPDKDSAVDAKKVITLHEVIEVPTLLLEYPSADALPTVNQAMTITVPAWDARQLWLNLNVASLEPGDWSTAVHLRTLESEPVELTAPLAVTVWMAALPEKQPLRLCHWGYVESSFLKDYPDEALADQVSHGTNVFVGLFPPQAKYDESGELVGTIDFAAHDAYVRRHARHGIILFCGYQGALQGPGGENGSAYAKAYVSWLRAWVKHLAELGVGYDGFALYPIDEIGLHPDLEPRYLHLAKLTREGDPKVQMYADLTTGLSDEELKELVPYIDIWCPNTAAYLFDKNHDKMEFIKSNGKTVWSYECYGVAKHQSPLGYYRAQAWRAWHHGLTGIGFWTYCTTSDDPWFSPRNNNEYTLVYPGNGVVSSKRWEAVRDGIEDYAMLTVLRKTWETPGIQQKHPEAAEAVEAVLGEKATAISESAHFDEWDAKPAPEGLADRRRESDALRRTYQSIREEIARLLSELTP